MQIIPAIELQNGRCVSLHRGRIEEPQIWHVDPVETAKSFAEAGAQWLHITDFDAVDGGDGNAEIVHDILRKCPIPVQYGGGIRSMDQVNSWIDAGAGRVVLATGAVLAPDLLKEAAKRYPDQIVLAVDVFQGRVVTNGWRNPSIFDPTDFLGNFELDPLAAVIITDIDAKIDDTDERLALITALAGVTHHTVISRGLARDLDDIARLKFVPDVAGTIISRALFNKSVDLADAIAVAEERAGQTAPFV